MKHGVYMSIYEAELQNYLGEHRGINLKYLMIDSTDIKNKESPTADYGHKFPTKAVQRLSVISDDKGFISSVEHSI